MKILIFTLLYKYLIFAIFWLILIRFFCLSRETFFVESDDNSNNN